MKDPRNKLAELINKSSWTAEEKKWLLNYLETSDAGELEELMRQQFEEDKLVTPLNPDLSKQMLFRIHERLGVAKQSNKAPVVNMRILKIAVAASVICLLAISAYFLLDRPDRNKVAKTEIRKNNYKTDVLPGRNKALLTLGNGSTIVLDDAHNGDLTRQGNTKITKIGGKLFYDPSDNGNNEIVYNVISTPRGGQFQVELPDGSQVWLNAASSLRFPSAFEGKERRVEITGEAYFEVAQNKAMPFIASVNGAEVQVLGTHFNVMAYSEEEAVKTTLLEGSVKFVRGNNASLLKPGQQVQLKKDGQIKVVSDLDVEKVIAWKNGYFHFDGADIGTVTRQLSRWYDVEVVQQKKIDEQFIAEIPRNTNLSNAIKALELTGKVHFKIEGKKNYRNALAEPVAQKSVTARF